MHLLAILAIALLVFAAPSWWVKRTLKRYQDPGDRYPGTGGELARHLLDNLGLDAVQVTRTDEQGDHYDPDQRRVCLSPEVHDQRSLTAVTVAAHEVGHAVQHADGYGPLLLRSRMAVFLPVATRLASGLLLFGPVAGIALRSPVLLAWSLVAGALSMLSVALFHLVTLPVEWDASFSRAMPLLRGILHPGDERHARRILRAAAFTYVAQALISVAAAWRWLRLP